MDNFRLFFENNNPDSIVQACQKARRDYGVKQCSSFGDCKDISKESMIILKSVGVVAQLVGGHFLANKNDGEEYDHSWLVVDGFVLDPTIDQFFSSLDEDLTTNIFGVYFSHPEWDGDKYLNRYNKFPQAH
jgi:hypothetical protein